LGVYQPGFPVHPEALARYTDLAGQPPAIVHYFQRMSPPSAFDPAASDLVHDAGAVPLLSWEPWQGLEPIVRGEWDAHLSAFAHAVAAHGKPLLLRFAHEMNLPQIPWFGPPETFRQAWHRVRRAFDDAGATNVRWVWSPYANGPGIADLRPYFPGPGLVDWPALDGYNWGRRSRWGLRSWPNFERIFGSSLRALAELAPAAPVMLAEIGCATAGGDKGAWMRDALLRAIPNQYPEIRAVVWFNQNRPDHADWRIDSSAASLAVWHEVVADARYQLSGVELLKGVSVSTR
jgi:beta-mannanase